MKYHVLVSVLVVFIACERKRTLVFKAENVEKLERGSKLAVDGLQIGQITKIALSRNGLPIVTAEIANDIQLSRDTKFRVEDAGLIGPKVITVFPGENPNPISEHDTLQLTAETSDADTFPLTSKFFQSLQKIQDCDSLKTEIANLQKRVNKLESRQKDK